MEDIYPTPYIIKEYNEDSAGSKRRQVRCRK